MNQNKGEGHLGFSVLGELEKGHSSYMCIQHDTLKGYVTLYGMLMWESVLLTFCHQLAVWS